MSKQIPFHKPFISGKESTFVNDVIRKGQVGTGGYYSHQCESFLENFTGAPKVLLTSSCTHALEISAILANIQIGDEVIMPSFNFVSAANAFVLRGAKIIFVDIDPETMNIDPECLQAAISPRTKAVLIMHYGGVACDMERIMPIIQEHNLFLVEDAAHCINATFNGKHLGTFGHVGTLSFHYTKNIHCGEGGALLINDKDLIARAEIIREKGTNRKQFFEGKIDKYSWVDIGSSYLMSEISAAFLWGQISEIENDTAQRKSILKKYKEILGDKIFPKDSTQNRSNGHCCFVKCNTSIERSKLILDLKQNKISANFHYIPLHDSIKGKKVSEFYGKNIHTTKESERILRLPIFNGLDTETIESICKIVLNHSTIYADL